MLSAESTDVVDALLDTSVVTRVNPALAAALTGRPDAGELLLEAQARGLFVTRLGPSGWLEVHAVVREELLAEVARRSPGRVATQHARAARWFEDAGEVTLALEHWLLAADLARRCDCSREHVAVLYDTGREATIARTISRIPQNVASADLQAQIEFAWCQLHVDKHRFLENVSHASASRERSDDPAPASAARLGMLQAIAATMTGDWAAGGRLATEAVSSSAGRARRIRWGGSDGTWSRATWRSPSAGTMTQAAARVGAPRAGPGPGATARLRRNARPG